MAVEYLKNIELTGETFKDACITFGVFDGFHKGHKFEVDACIKQAKELNLKSKILTFDIDPDEIFIDDFKKLQSNNNRIKTLENSGVDSVVVIEFLKIQNLKAEDFLNKIFKGIPPFSVHVGTNFYFGNKKSGDSQFLKQ